jgi:glycerate kinase
VAATRPRDGRLRAGTGAAGGLAFGLSAVLGATLTPGIEWLLEATDFGEAAARADLIIVGEGSLDRQSLHGKGPIGIARAAAQYDVRVVAVVGRCLLTSTEATQAGLSRVYPLSDLMADQARCMSHAEQLLARTGELIAHELSSQAPVQGRQQASPDSPSAHIQIDSNPLLSEEMS